MIVTYERDGKTYSCDTSKLPEKSIEYLLQYGWAQSLQDSIAGAAKRAREDYLALAKEAGETPTESDIAETVAQAVEGLLSKRADSIQAGNVGVRVGQPRDPFAAMCKRIATSMLRQGFKAANMKWPKDQDKVNELVAKVLVDHKDKIEAEATRRLETEKDMVIDLG